MSRNKWGVIFSGMLLAPFAGQAFAGGKSELFAPLPLVMRSAQGDAALAAIQRNPTSHAISVVQANAESVNADTASIGIGLDIGDGIHVNALRQQSYTTPDGLLVWQGKVDLPRKMTDVAAASDTEVENDAANQVILVRNGNLITGSVHIAGQLYRIRPLKNGQHAIVEVNENLMPADHPPAAYKKLYTDSFNLPQALDAAVEAQPNAVLANTVIRVMVNYTQGVKAAVGDVAGLINLAVAESNTGYSNSGVAITMQLAASSQVTYTETGNFDTDLARYRSTSDGYMDSIHTLRNSSAADVGVLLVTNNAYCGLASAIGASASTAFAEVYYDCATGYYSFAHEIGHLQSARHDPANDPTNTPYAYGHGYQYPTGGWRTIMAYACASVSCTRLNYWSNPGKTYGGHAMGTTTKNDNHRVLNNTAATVAAFR